MGALRQLGAGPLSLENADDKIVFDRFHIMAHMTKAVDTVRESEDHAGPSGRALTVESAPRDAR